MTTERRKTRGELRAMFWHDFVGSLADNMVEVNWMLVVTLFPVMAGADDIVAMFGLTDTVWVVLSIMYYAARMGLNAFMPQFMVGRDSASASMPLKNAWYLTMLAMAPLVLIGAVFTAPIMTWLGAPAELLPLYCNYFRLGLISVYLACPAGVLIPAYLRATFQNKKAMLLDHAVTWSMAAGCWFTVHVLHEGAVVMMLVALLAHSIPTVWFVLTRPIPGFFSRGLEWDTAALQIGFKYPVVWLCVTVANVIRVRYYVLLSITRAAHRELNGFAMTSFAVIASVATPLATVVFLDWMQMGLLAVYLTGAVVPVLQILVLEWKLRSHHITIREEVAA